ncbi:MAG: YdcF family protein [Deltaproteobacteria bacterium]|nr:YdcF family protein [Deltaproteobacteria bacterium]
MKKRAYILIAALISAYLLHLFFGFAEAVRGFGPSKGKADVIVVLTGGRNRADEGLRLLREGRAGTLVLSGVHRDSGINSIFLNKTGRGERSKIILEKASSSTHENAIEVRRLAAERGYGSMILLTSGYHMKRAEFIFRSVMPPDFSIETHSVSTPNYDEQRWWAGKGLAVLAPEFMKYYWYAGRFALEGRVKGF